MQWVHAIQQALIGYCFFIPLLTFHEFAHAWVAWKCGDDTAYNRGRVSLNPIVHMELIGTVILPLAGMIAAALGTWLPIFGWGKPVPVNPYNLKHPRIQDSLIAMAGPAMNLLLAFVLLLIVRAADAREMFQLSQICREMTMYSLVLCFFNLIPIPPLDGSHLLLNLTRMSYETYYRLAQFGFFIVIIAIQLRPVQAALSQTLNFSYRALAKIIGVEVG